METKRNSKVMRAQAEALARKKFGAPASNLLTPEDTAALLHELRVHQIQLEMQNEELYNTQLALEESRARYIDLYDFAPVGYCSISLDGGMIIEANWMLTSLLGLSRVALIGKPFTRFIAAVDQDRFYLLKKRILAEHAQTAPEGESSHGIELRLTATDGRVFWVRLAAARTLNLGLQQLRIVVTDISANKRVETELGSSERRLRAIIETEPECVKLLSADGSLLEMNAAGLRMMEAESFQEIEKHCVYGFVNEPHRAAFRALTKRVFQGESGILEFQITGLKGTSRWLETHASPLRDDSGNIIASLGITRDINERKLAEASLRLSDVALKSISQGVIITDADQRIISVNTAFTAITGYSTAEILGRECKFLQGPETDPETVAAIRLALKNNREFSGEILNYRKIGASFWNELTISPVLDAQGAATHYIGVTRDITTRRLIEMANQETTMQLRLVIRGGDIGFWDWDIPNHGLAVNDRWFTMLGLDPHGPSGIDLWHSLVHPEDTHKLTNLFESVILNPQGVSGEAEIRARHRAGHYIWLIDRFSVVERSSDGKPLRVVGTHLDITERKQAEALLRADNQILQMTASGAQLLDVLEAIVKSIESASHGALCSILLLDEDGLHLRHGAGSSLPQDYNRAINGLAIGKNVGSCGTAAHDKESVIVADIANDPRWANYRELALRHGLKACWSAPIKDANDRVLGTFAMYYREPRVPDPLDFRLVEIATNQAKIIIERKQMDEQLRQTASNLEQRVIERTQELQAAQLSKTRFFAAASHDLLQPLNAARIFASSLVEQRDLSEASLHIVQRIDSALLSAEEVIDVLVDVAKLDTGAVRAVIEDVHLNEMLAGMADQFSPIAERRNLQLRIGSCQVSVRSDRRLLRRVLQNLISNALRYTARGGVLVGVRRLPGAQIRIDVIDTGPGIPSAASSEIFEEFQRGGHSSPWGEKGMGLGLAICMRICKLLGHTLSVNSVPGRGSTFSVSLGNFRAGSVVSLPLPTLHAQFSLSSLRILCVDDDNNVLDAMLTLLRSWGVSCDQANTRSSALEAARMLRPDVVIVDYQFDDAHSDDGLQIISALRDLYPKRPPVAIMITANRSVELKEATKMLGISLLNKPLRAARLRSLLESVSRGCA